LAALTFCRRVGGVTTACRFKTEKTAALTMCDVKPEPASTVFFGVSPLPT
jgi:hypothetical protein